MKIASVLVLLAVSAGACSGEEPVTLHKGDVVPSSAGKCDQLFGAVTYDVNCPKK